MKLILLMASTLDGRIGKNQDHFPDWTGKADKQFFAALSREAGAVIMGSRTFDTIGRPLPGRMNVVMTRDKTRRSSWENLRYTDAVPEAVLAQLEKDGYEQAILAGGATINSLFAASRCIDEIVVTISPLIFGSGIGLFTDGISLSLQLKEVRRLGRDRVCLTYRVLK